MMVAGSACRCEKEMLRRDPFRIDEEDLRKTLNQPAQTLLLSVV